MQCLHVLFHSQLVRGDSGTIHFPFLVSAAGDWSIRFLLLEGDGKVAIDNACIYQGGVGPWRRDFENGLVLVNPLKTAHTFSAAELASIFHLRKKALTGKVGLRLRGMIREICLGHEVSIKG